MSNTPTVTTGEVTGYSNGLSFDEAFEDAVKKLARRPKHPDELINIEVVKSGAELGGIAGLRRMYVTVRERDG